MTIEGQFHAAGRRRLRALWCRYVRQSVVIIGLLLNPSGGAVSGEQTGVRYLQIEGVREFPEATQAGAIRYACASNQKQLKALFDESGSRFEPRLVHRIRGSGYCHIFFEPTIPGFRAHPENWTFAGLFAGIDPVSFVAGRKPIGDSLDIVKTVLSRLSHPVAITLSLPKTFAEEPWPNALASHFPQTIHKLSIQPSAATTEHPWAQDYMKAGAVDGTLRILVPRRLFEGRSTNGETYTPLLDEFQAPTFVRSKLSWEGGDIQLATDPKDPQKRILFFGGAARQYWGRNLSPEEYAYILRTEFGAEKAVDLSAFGLHADFVVALLGKGKAVLMASPVREDFKVARAVTFELLRFFGGNAPEELRQLAGYFDTAVKDTGWDPGRPLQLVKRLHKLLPLIPPTDDSALRSELAEYMEHYCPGEASLCSSPRDLEAMFLRSPDLFRRAANEAADRQIRRMAVSRLLALIEGQLPGAPSWNDELVQAAERVIRRHGFRLIRIPYLPAPSMTAEWAGISYANLLHYRGALFVPVFGLGEAEETILAGIRRQLGDAYEIVPVYARFSLLNNAGVHCAFGIVPHH